MPLPTTVLQEIGRLNGTLSNLGLEQFRSLPSELFHYSDPGGLLGILTSDCLYATHFGYLNDPGEFRYGVSVIDNVFRQMAADNPDPRVGSFYDGTLKALRDLENGRYAWFITCFCQDGDVLSQWRGYGAAGGGYSIGLDPVKLSGKDFMGWPTNWIYRILYSPEEQENPIRGILDLLLPALEAQLVTVPDSAANELIDKYVELAVMFMGNWVFSLKHEAYREEAEWRVILRLDMEDRQQFSHVHYRQSRSTIVPFVKFGIGERQPYARLPVTRVVIGPTGDKDLAVKSVNWLLKSTQHDAVAQASSIPFRG